MPFVQQGLIYNLELFCPTPVLMGFLLLKLYFFNEDNFVPFVLSFSLTFVLRYVGSGNINVVFRISLYSLGFNLSLYLVRILYFVGFWLIIRLHQSNQTHSTTCQALLICMYQIPSIFLCCDLQNMNMLIQ